MGAGQTRHEVQRSVAVHTHAYTCMYMYMYTVHIHVHVYIMYMDFRVCIANKGLNKQEEEICNVHAHVHLYSIAILVRTVHEAFSLSVIFPLHACIYMYMYI